MWLGSAWNNSEGEDEVEARAVAKEAASEKGNAEGRAWAVQSYEAGEK